MSDHKGTEVDSANTDNSLGDDDHLQLTMSYRLIIASNTKRLRERLGLRQVDLAKLMGTAQGQVASLETARISIGLHTITRLATALNIEPPQLLLPFKVEPDVNHPVNATLPTPNSTSLAPELLTGNLAVGVSLTTVKGIVAATYKRLEALERRHGSVPMTREMLTSVLVALLNASQNIDSDGDDAK